MRRMSLFRGMVMLVAIFGLMNLGIARAQDATPEVPVATPEAVAATTAPVELMLVEQAVNVNMVDFGNDGPTPGDMIVWGLDPLYNVDDLEDTGSVTYGTCVMVNTDGDCMAQENFIFADGSTLAVQGLEFGATIPSIKTIVGGSGIFLGATGTLTDIPDETRSTWTKHFRYWPGPYAPVE